MNVFQFAAQAEANFELSLFNNCNEPSYQRQTTWASDLAIALWYEKFVGEKGAINKTVNDCKKNFPHSYTYIMEMVAALNYMCWFCYQNEDFKNWCKLFSDLYYDMFYDFAEKNLSEEDFLHMCRFLD